MSPDKSMFSANKENRTHMFSPACFPWKLHFISNTYIPHSPSTDLKSLSQMSTKNFDTGQVLNMTCSLLAFCLAFSFSIALFFPPCLSPMYYAAALVLSCSLMSLHAFGHFPLPCWRMSGSCTDLGVLMKPFPCVWCPLSAGILVLSAGLRKLWLHGFQSSLRSILMV